MNRDTFFAGLALLLGFIVGAGVAAARVQSELERGRTECAREHNVFTCERGPWQPIREQAE